LLQIRFRGTASALLFVQLATVVGASRRCSSRLDTAARLRALARIAALRESSRTQARPSPCVWDFYVRLAVGMVASTA